MIRIRLVPTPTLDEAVASASEALCRARAGEVIEYGGTDLQILAFRLLIARGEMLPSEIELTAPNGKTIPLDDLGTPTWWPDNLFTQTHLALLAIHSSLSDRSKESS